MHQIWVPLNDIPSGGQEYEVDDAAVWSAPITEFKLPFRVTSSLRGAVFLLPQDDGCLVRGHLTGTVVIPCDRCAENAEVVIDHRFDNFEPFPKGEDNEEGDSDAETIRFAPEGKGYELSLSGLLWEEFLLALPVKPLCGPSCEGLCPSCGKNLNEGPCSCHQEEGDPRLAVLRGMKLDKH